MPRLQSNSNISFIMPAYNAEATIKESVDSIMKSNFSAGDELIVVNDCSSDETHKILAQLKENYGDKIIIINHKRNKGGGAARNTAAEAAKNPLIFCLDSDNILAPKSIKKLRDHLLKSRGDIATFETLKYFNGDTKNVTHEWHFKSKNSTLAGAFSSIQFPGASGNYLYTKDSWIKAGGYPEFAGALDAWGFGLRQVASGSRIVILPNSFYYHRYGHESYWVRESKNGQTSLRALQLMIPYLDRINEKDIDYMMSRSGRYSWFENIEKHPIKLKTRVSSKPSLFQKTKDKLRRQK